MENGVCALAFFLLYRHSHALYKTCKPSNKGIEQESCGQKKASTLDTPKKGWNPNIHEDCESERILQGVESL